MIKILYIFLILYPTILFSQLRDSVKIKTPIFEIIYSEIKESPLLVKYHVECPMGTIPRTGMNFYGNDSIHTSDDLDYINNVYDKGHMAPAADFNCTKELLKQTFTYLNCVLQNQYLNRGVWKMLEIQERLWAKNDDVDVTIEIKFNKTCKKLVSGAAIPLGFYKTIKLKKKNKVYKYYFPNIKPVKDKFLYYQIK
jgi:endonuclease G